MFGTKDYIHHFSVNTSARSSMKHGVREAADCFRLREEPFMVRPDESRRSAWGDPVRVGTRVRTWRAWETLAASLRLFRPSSTQMSQRDQQWQEPVSRVAGFFSRDLVLDVDEFFQVLEDASDGGFLRGGLTKIEATGEIFGEAAWFRCKGDYSIGELLANKIELLLCQGWYADRSKRPARKPSSESVAICSFSGYSEERQALESFLFTDLSDPQARLRCILSAMAMVIRQVIRKEKEKMVVGDGAFKMWCCQLKFMIETTQQLPYQQKKLQCLLTGDTKDQGLREAFLDDLFSAKLGDAISEPQRYGHIQALLRAELMERRTSWKQRRLLDELEQEGIEKKINGSLQPFAGTTSTIASLTPVGTVKKKKKKRRDKCPDPAPVSVTLSGNVATGEYRTVMQEEQKHTADLRDTNVQGTIKLIARKDGEDRHFSRALSSPPCLTSIKMIEGPSIEMDSGSKTVMRESENSKPRNEHLPTGFSRCVQYDERKRDEGVMCFYKDEEREKNSLTVETQKMARKCEIKDEVLAEYEDVDGDGSSMTCDGQQDESVTDTENIPPENSLCQGGAVTSASSNDTLLKDLCLKLEAEVATLRGVLAAQREAISSGSGNLHTSYTHSLAFPSYGFDSAPLHTKHVPPYQHPFLQRSELHQLEIMSDDGRGGGADGTATAAWLGEGSQHHVALSAVSQFAANGGIENLYPGNGDKPVLSIAAATSTRNCIHGKRTGSSFEVSIPRNPSGPLHVWGERQPLINPIQQPQRNHVSQDHRQSRHALSASVSLGGDDVCTHSSLSTPGVAHANSTYQAECEIPALHAGREWSRHSENGPCQSSAHVCFGFTLRQIPLDFRSRLCDDIAAFVERVSVCTGSRLPQQTVAINRCRQVIQSLWPRAQVKAFGSFVSGLALPSSDVDLIICLPNVRRDAPAQAPGVLEGRNAIKETWQQELARRLRATSWVNPASIKIISHTAIPVIKMTVESQPRPSPASPHPTSPVERGTGTVASGQHSEMAAASQRPHSCRNEADLSAEPEGVALNMGWTVEYGVHLDVSIEGGQHNGLLANRVIAKLLGENFALRPLVLVLKQFMKERGLMESYSGGLSSYGLVLMVARYLQEQSNAMDTGALLLGFLDFYSNHFDPRSMGISTNQRCYFSRSSQQSHLHHQHHQHHQQNMPPLGSNRRVSLGGAGDVHLPYYYVHQQQQVRPAGGSFLENPYKFDPLYIEDPIRPSNNIGRNCFRIFQIQRAWNDAWRDLDPGSSGGVPRLNRIVQSDVGSKS